MCMKHTRFIQYSFERLMVLLQSRGKSVACLMTFLRTYVWNTVWIFLEGESVIDYLNNGQPQTARPGKELTYPEDVSVDFIAGLVCALYFYYNSSCFIFRTLSTSWTPRRRTCLTCETPTSWWARTTSQRSATSTSRPCCTTSKSASSTPSSSTLTAVGDVLTV